MLITPSSNTRMETGCIDDTWTASPTSRWSIGSYRRLTGSEMIIWGGPALWTFLTPAERTTPLQTLGRQPPLRMRPMADSLPHGSVDWQRNDCLGRIHLGRCVRPNQSNTGGRYNPVMNSWTATATNNGLTDDPHILRFGTGNEMLVWGGTSISSLSRILRGDIILTQIAGRPRARLMAPRDADQATQRSGPVVK